jgi:hypothetical protein
MEHNCPTCQQPMKQAAATLILSSDHWYMDSSGLVVKRQPIYDYYCAACDYSEIHTQDGSELFLSGSTRET